jgi:hypothetical protein
VKILISTFKLEAVYTSDTMVTPYETTLCHNPENQNTGVYQQSLHWSEIKRPTPQANSSQNSVHNGLKDKNTTGHKNNSTHFYVALKPRDLYHSLACCF